MYPDGLITIGGEKYLTLYGICIAIGIVCCILTLHFLGNKLGSDKKFLSNVETIGYAAILAGLFSSALFQGIYNWIDGDGFSLTGGITFIGGLIGGVVTFIAIFFIVKNKLTGKFVEVLYVAPTCILVAHGFGRVGCFFAGCCGGIKTDSWLGMKFPHYSYKIYPTQLFEAIFLLTLFAVLFILIWKKKFKYSFTVYLGLYGIWRFLIEYIRGDDRGSFVGNISPSQFWALVMIALSVPLYFLVKYLTKQKELSDNKEKELPEAIE